MQIVPVLINFDLMAKPTRQDNRPPECLKQMLSLGLCLEPGGVRMSQMMLLSHRISTPLKADRAVMKQVFLDNSITCQVDPLMCL